MDEYIKRKDALVAIQNLYPGIPFTKVARQRWHDNNRSYMQCERAIESIPAADVVEARHGRWLTKEYMYGDPDVGIEDMWIDRLAEQSDYYAYCSICGKDAEYNAEGSLILSDFCPNCGARMDGGEDDGKT